MDASRTLTMLTRVGFAARGLLYIVIALLVLRAGRVEDPSGALAELGESGGGVFLIIALFGFVAYGLWRLSDALFNIEGHESGSKGVRKRLGAGGSGVVHLFLAWQAFRLMNRSGGGGGGSSNSAESNTQTALQLPGGEILVIAGGLILIAAGVFQLIKAFKCSFCRNLDASVANEAWVKIVGRAGYSARGLVFLISGYFILQAGLDSQASEAGGMAEAMAWLSDPWDKIIAVGLLLFGAFSLIEARYRRIHAPPVGAMADNARSHLPL